MTVRQIQQTAQAFGEAARRAREAGFDEVEIHSAHGYLLNQFYSSLANHRSDAYGPRSVENWTRFHREVLQAVQIPVLLTGGGTTLAQAQALLEEGSADLIRVGRAIFRDSHWAD